MTWEPQALRVLLAGDAGAREEEYVANGPHTGLLTLVSVQKYNSRELNLRALLTQDGPGRLELVPDAL